LELQFSGLFAFALIYRKMYRTNSDVAWFSNFILSNT